MRRQSFSCKPPSRIRILFISGQSIRGASIRFTWPKAWRTGRSRPACNGWSRSTPLQPLLNHPPHEPHTCRQSSTNEARSTPDDSVTLQARTAIAPAGAPLVGMPCCRSSPAPKVMLQTYQLGKRSARPKRAPVLQHGRPGLFALRPAERPIREASSLRNGARCGGVCGIPAASGAVGRVAVAAAWSST